MAAAKPTSADRFVRFFRASAPYIHAHRGRTFVIRFGGEAVGDPRFVDLIHDIALLHSLGIRIVLVHGARPQIESRLKANKRRSEFVGGRRVTDPATLTAVKEAVGVVRLDVESLLSMGLPNSPMAGARIRVTSGNVVVAQPLGVVDGTDFQHTGRIRRVDTQAIRQWLAEGSIVLLSPLGCSLTGEVFNVDSHDVAAAAAGALGADKLVSLVEGAVLDSRRRPVHTVSPEETQTILQRKRLGMDVRRNLEAAYTACTQGVRRVHLIDRRQDGSLLLELFTRDGVGTMITSENYDGVRAARGDDVGGILELLAPLEAQGNLIRRSRETLQSDISRFTVVERDGMVIACAALYPLTDRGVAEVAAVAVHPEHRQDGRGEQLLSFIERRAQSSGVRRLVVMTTQSAHWFRERGFEVGTPRDLPASRRSRLDKKRKSKVLVKDLQAR